MVGPLKAHCIGMNRIGLWLLVLIFSMPEIKVNAMTTVNVTGSLRRRLAQDTIPYFAQGGINPLLGFNKDYPNPITNPANLVYAILIIFVVANFLSPILFYIYRVFLVRLVKVVTEKAKELSVKISERISDAGRRYSERMRA